MDIVGWTEARMLSRYQHLVDELRRDAHLDVEPTETKDLRLKIVGARTHKASDPGSTRSEASSWSRLSESNR
jgi:hypothetical protein